MTNGSGTDDGFGIGPQIERRDLLGGLLAGTGLALAGCAQATGGEAAAAAEPQNQSGYYPPQRVGLRGSHPGSFENAHALRDGTLALEEAEKIDEHYDLIIVGGGISGLSAAYFLHAEKPDARILILENHDDFGGHAKRNEFTVNGQTLLINGGTMLISSPRPYSEIPHRLLQDLGIDAEALSKKYPTGDFSENLKLGRGIYFDKETFGADKLTIMPARDNPDGSSPSEALATALAQSPLPPQAQRDIVRLQFDKIDYLPGANETEKRRRLATMSYRDYLANLVKMHPAAIAVFQTRTHGEWGVGIDGEPALDCWGLGLPGFDGLGLDRSKTDFMGYTAAGYGSTGGSPSFHFPDGNATIARALVRKLVPAVAPPGDIESIVAAKFDYGQLDRPGQSVRIRLNSVVVNVAAQGDDRVTITYMTNGKLKSVSANASVLACYNMMIPYLVPTLPDKQKAALRELVKVPLVYTSVAVRNWRPFAKLGVRRIECPGSYFSSVSLSEAPRIGGYIGPRSPDDPAIIFMLRTPCQPGADTQRDQHRAGRFELLDTPFEVFEKNIYAQLTGVLGPGGFEAERDIAAIAVNRWPHGYAYEYNSLYDPWDVPPNQRPHVIGRQRFGRIAIANSDAGGAAYTDCAIEQGYRAVHELLDAKLLTA